MKKEMIVIVSSLFVTLASILLVSYAYFRPKRAAQPVTTSSAAVVSKVVGLNANYENNLASVFQNLVPSKDEYALTNNPGFSFSVTNISNGRVCYKIILEEDALGLNEVKLNSAFLKINISKAGEPDIDNTYYYAELDQGIIMTSFIGVNETQEYVIKAWIDEDAPILIKGKSLNLHITLDLFSEPVSKSAEKYFRDHNNLKDAIRCELDYTNCGTGNITDLNTVINSNSESVIILTKDIEFDDDDDKIVIPSGRSVVFDLNGYKIKKTDRKAIFENAGNLRIIDSMHTGKVVNTYDGSNGYTVSTTGYLIIEGGTFITNSGTVVLVGTSTTATGKAELKPSAVFKELNKEGSGLIFDIYSADSSPLKTNCVAISKSTNSVFDNNESISGTVKIYGGKYIHFFRRVIHGKYTMNYNIVPTDPLYIGSYGGDSYGAIVNKGSGTFNINATPAVVCNENPNDTTSGMCAYAASYYDSHADGRVNNYALANWEDGVINALGGTYNGDKVSVFNNKNGTLNIMSAKIISNRYGIQNNSSSSYSGILNMCNITFSGNPSRYDISAEGLGQLSYYDVTFSNGTQTPSSNSIEDDNHVITLTDHCVLTN